MLNYQELCHIQLALQTKQAYWNKLQSERTVVVQACHVTLFIAAIVAYQIGLEASLSRSLSIAFLIDLIISILSAYIRSSRMSNGPFMLGLPGKIEFLNQLGDSLNRDLVAYIQVFDTKQLSEVESKLVETKWADVCDYEHKFML